MGEIEISKTMVQHSKTAILLADDTKFGKSALYKTSNLEDLDIIITTDIKDFEVEEEFLKYDFEIIKTEENELND
jgi:DeoR family glycerol-3-phosphate regulon repressor